MDNDSKGYFGKVDFPERRFEDNLDYARKFSLYVQSFYSTLIPISANKTKQKQNNFIYVFSGDRNLIENFREDVLERGLAKDVRIELASKLIFGKKCSFSEANQNFIN